MIPNSILSELINKAVKDCWELGCGDVTEEEYDSELRVTAEWVLSETQPGMSVIHICVYKRDIVVLAYTDESLALAC